MLCNAQSQNQTQQRQRQILLQLRLKRSEYDDRSRNVVLGQTQREKVPSC